MLNRKNQDVKTLMASGHAEGNRLFIGFSGDLRRLSNMIDITDKPDNTANIEAPFGELQRFINIWNSGEDLISRDVRRTEQQLALMIRLIGTPYSDYHIEPVLFSYSVEGMNASPQTKKNKQIIHDALIKHSRKQRGYCEDPDHIVLIYRVARDERSLIGIYEAESGMPVPSANADHTICGMSVTEYLDKNPEICERLRVYLTMLRFNKKSMADQDYRYENVVKRLDGLINSKYVGGSAGLQTVEQFKGEPIQTLPENVVKYIRTCTPGMDPGLAFGHLGTAEDSPLLNNISVMYFENDTEPVAGTVKYYAAVRVEDTEHTRILLPPIRPVDGNVRVDYHQEQDWIRVTAYIGSNGSTSVFQKIYSSAGKAYNHVRPSHIIEMYPGVPDALVTKHLYYEMPNTSGSVNELSCEWDMLSDGRGNAAEVRSSQKRIKCSIYEKTGRLKYITLKEKNSGNILGTIFMAPKSFNPASGNSGNKVTVAIDNGASTSVRLVEKGAGRGPLEYKGLAGPVTPCGKESLEELELSFVNPLSGNEQSYESMIQTHSLKGSLTALGTQDRLFSMKGEEYYRLFSGDTRSMTSLNDRFGIMAYPKTVMMRLNLSDSASRSYRDGYKKQVALGILTTVMAEAVKGYAPAYGNLKIDLAYPNSGHGNIGSDAVKKVYQQAVALVNTFLSPANQLAFGKSVCLRSESEAAGYWLKKSRNGLNGVPLVVDIGHSTTDVGFYVNSCLFSASVPCGGDEITIQTIADVYGSEERIEDLLKCFSDVDDKNRNVISDALRSSVRGKQPGIRLRDTAGFPIVLMHMFDSYPFSNTTVNPDPYQVHMQNLTGLRLHMILPAIVQVIRMACEKQAISLEQDIEIVFAGKGAKAIRNTGSGFQDMFISEISSQLQCMNFAYKGKISIQNPADDAKIAIAEGMLDLDQAITVGANIQVVDVNDPLHAYISLLYDGNKAEIEEREKMLAELRDDATTIDVYEDEKRIIVHDAFLKMVEQYTLDKFHEDFNSFGHSEEEFAREDSQLYKFIREKFSPLLDKIRTDYEAYVMSLPQMEREQISAALISIGCELLAQVNEQQSQGET